MEILKQYEKDLFDSSPDVLSESKIIIDNILAYIAFSQEPELKKQFLQLPIQHKEIIEIIIENEPQIKEIVKKGIVNRKRSASELKIF